MTFRKPSTKLLFESPSVSSGEEAELKRFDFEFERKLGDGAFGQVWRVRHKKTMNLYALKQVPKEKVSKMLSQFRREVYIMYEINHPHIIKLYNHFEDEKFFYLIMELAEGNLFHKLYREKHFLEKVAAQFFREVLLAVEYLHSHVPSIIHRDIKPENILLDKEGRLKLTDFGWSNYYSSESPTLRFTTCGTLEYLPPEMVQELGHNTSADIWCLGILLYEMLVGMTPFKSSLREQMLSNISTAKLKFPLSTPQLAKDLISKMLEKDQIKRPTAAQIKEHPWMKEHQPIRPTITQDLLPKVIPESQVIKAGYLVINKESKEKKTEETEYSEVPVVSSYRKSVNLIKHELEDKSKESMNVRKVIQEKSLIHQKLEEEVKRLEAKIALKKKELSNRVLAEKDIILQLSDLNIDLDKVARIYKSSDLNEKIKEQAVLLMEKNRECKRLQSFLATTRESVKMHYQAVNEKEKTLALQRNKLQGLKLEFNSKVDERKSKIDDKKITHDVLKTRIGTQCKSTREIGKDEMKLSEDIKNIVKNLAVVLKPAGNVEDLLFKAQEKIIEKEQELSKLTCEFEENRSEILQNHRKNKEDLMKSIKTKNGFEDIAEKERCAKIAESLRQDISAIRKEALSYDVNPSEVLKSKILTQETLTKLHMIDGRIEAIQSQRLHNKKVFNHNSFTLEQMEMQIGILKSTHLFKSQYSSEFN